MGRLDRLGRSIRHLIDVVGCVGGAGRRFKSLTEAIVITAAGGRLLFRVLGSLAARQLIRVCTIAGLSAARARGRNGGRPSKMTPEKLRVAREMHDSREHTLEVTARTVGVGRTTLYRYLSASARTTA